MWRSGAHSGDRARLVVRQIDHRGDRIPASDLGWRLGNLPRLCRDSDVSASTATTSRPDPPGCLQLVAGTSCAVDGSRRGRASGRAAVPATRAVEKSSFDRGGRVEHVCERKTFAESAPESPRLAWRVPIGRAPGLCLTYVSLPFACQCAGDACCDVLVGSRECGCGCRGRVGRCRERRWRDVGVGYLSLGGACDRGFVVPGDAGFEGDWRLGDG